MAQEPVYVLEVDGNQDVLNIVELGSLEEVSVVFGSLLLLNDGLARQVAIAVVGLETRHVGKGVHDRIVEPAFGPVLVGNKSVELSRSDMFALWVFIPQPWLLLSSFELVNGILPVSVLLLVIFILSLLCYYLQGTRAIAFTAERVVERGLLSLDRGRRQCPRGSPSQLL